MAKGTTPGREQIIRRMWKLANAGVEDAVKLACFPTEEWGGLEGMNLDALTEEDAKIEIFPTVILALPDNVLKASVDETLAALDKYRRASKTDKEDEV